MRNITLTASILIAFIIGFTTGVTYVAETESLKQKASFQFETLPNGLVETVVIPDGNRWITTKDSVLIYVENY